MNPDGLLSNIEEGWLFLKFLRTLFETVRSGFFKNNKSDRCFLVSPKHYSVRNLLAERLRVCLNLSMISLWTFTDL